MSIIVWLVMGGVVGWIASMIMGTNAQQGIILNVVGHRRVAERRGGAARHRKLIPAQLHTLRDVTGRVAGTRGGPLATVEKRTNTDVIVPFSAERRHASVFG